MKGNQLLSELPNRASTAIMQSWPINPISKQAANSKQQTAKQTHNSQPGVNRGQHVSSMRVRGSAAVFSVHLLKLRVSMCLARARAHILTTKPAVSCQ